MLTRVAFLLWGNPLLMKHVCESGIDAVNDHCAAGQQRAGQRAKIYKRTKSLP